MRKNTCSKCKNPLEENRVEKYRYCNACHAEWMRLNRHKHSELNDEQRKKANCRSHTKVYLKRGLIKKASCEKCGNHNSQAHHLDYSKPKLVEWYCRPCHIEIHKLKIA